MNATPTAAAMRIAPASLLIVDDAPANLDVVVDNLTERGFRVLIALKGEEAVERASFLQPELILLDVNMPGMDGFETCRRLKADPRTSDIPVIFMTVGHDVTNMVEGFNAGGIDYVTKPVRIDEMMARINVHLTMRAMTRTLVEKNRRLEDEVAVREQAERELSRTRDELEVRVAKRTDELARANMDLRAQIEERERTEAKLKLSEARLRMIVEASPVPLAITSLPKERILYANESLRQLFRIDETAQYLLDPAELYVDKAERARVINHLKRDSRISNREVRFKRLDGSTFWGIVTGRLAAYEDAPAIYWGFNDVTERKHIEQELVESREQLRQLGAHMEAVLEEERKRIALEIHDELGQLLTALKMDVSLLKMRLSESPDLLKRVAEMRDLVEKTILMVRNVANHLRPAALNFGLASALEWLAEDFGKRTGIPCQFLMTASEPVLSDAHATAVFRVVQESLTNVARHARATRVHVSVTRSVLGFELHVSDNGCGFDPAAAGKRDSYGLLGMSERARLIGASLQIDSVPGAGTVISISIPPPHSVNSGTQHDQNLDRR
jgi:PAS domain S-box-containing protein